MKLAKAAGLAVVALGSIGVLCAMLAPGSLTISGKTVTTDYIEKGGRVYVPLADVGRALNMNVTKSASGYALEPVGGANQVEGLRGKVGDVLRAPEFTFSVSKVITSEHYAKQFGTGNLDAEQGRTIVAIVCRVKNATSKTMYFNPFGKDRTALTDADEHTYSCFTGGWADVPAGVPSVLPGAAYDFALTFQVPSSAKLKDLVYEFDSMEVRAPRVLRISLSP